MTKRYLKMLSALLAIIIVVSILPVSVFAACSHSYEKVYTMENADMHSYVSKCTKCGTVTEGWGYSGWLDHTFDSYGVCTLCSFCNHSNNRKVYTYENDNMHSYYSICNSCDKTLTGYGYADWSDHSYEGNICVDCGFSKACSHSGKSQKYEDDSITSHKVNSVCNNCGIICSTTTASHSWSYGSWSSDSATKHSRNKSCVCGRKTSETASHSFSGNLCTTCGYQKEQAPTVNASVSLSATGPSGTLGSGGGEIAAETVPASYTVSATANNCEITKISYVVNGTTRTVNGSSVTITASTLSDFQTTTFTAYTNVSGVTATFTVNFKYVSYDTAYIMWETFHEATIRSITGNGLNKTLEYTMVLDNSYDYQANLTDEQRATLQSLIGISDGKTYMINYTRMIRVYTPASLSATGEKVIHGTFDGNVPSEIETCVNTWGWGNDTKAAIRQAASSSLSFTTSLPVNCTAIWIDTSTGNQLYSTSNFHGVSAITPDQACVISISYSDYPDSESYVYESLIYSGDTSGSSTSETYSQTYTVNSSPLTVTFYCHSNATEGSITVMAIDADTRELIPTAKVICDDVKMSENPHTFSNLEFGTYEVSAIASGYTTDESTVTISNSSPTKTVELELYKIEGEITVTVKDSDTLEPIKNAYVRNDNIHGYTNANGVICFTGLDYGNYTFTAGASTYATNSATTTVTAYNRSVGIIIYLDPLSEEYGDIGVTVLDSSTDMPIKEATVTGCGETLTTNIYGKVSFNDLPFGEYDITASMDGYVTATNTATIYLDSPTDDITIYLDPPPTKGNIIVKVIDEKAGTPLPDAEVSNEEYSQTTNSTGYAYFNDLPLGSYSFTATADRYYSSSKSAVISQSDNSDTITISLKPIPEKGSITVIVKDKETDKVISGASVSTVVYNNITDSNGTVLFDDLIFNSYTINVSAECFKDASESCIIDENTPDAELTIYLDRQTTDLTVESIINGDIYKGSTIIVPATVINNGEVDLTPSIPASVTMTATYNNGIVFDTQTSNVIVPANKSNLVWFIVTIPEDGYTSNHIEFRFDVVTPSGITEANQTNDKTTVRKEVYDVPTRNCEDCGFETEMPSSFKYSQFKENTAASLSWKVYEWNGSFYLKTYTIKLMLIATLTPDESAGYRVKDGNIWTTRSGYGVNTEVAVLIGTQTDDYVGNLKVDAFYPEHNYSVSASYSDNLEQVGYYYLFKSNNSSANKARMHSIPLWFPDGAYAVKYYAYDIWCPAGMLSGYTNAYVIIDGDMYDDLYTN